MISVREALHLVLERLPRLGAEMVPITRARGRVLAQPVRSPRDVPPFRNSAMDGYAVRAADVTGASVERSVTLRVLETVGAGAVPSRDLSPGTAIRIMTGAAVPDGADAVVRVEDTRDAGEDVEIRGAVPPGANVRNPGEDVRRDEELFTPGRILRPADVGLLASIGTAVVRVSRRPRVAILATGDELVDLGQAPGPGQIVNSNAYTLAAAVEESGGAPLVLGIIRDRPEEIRAAFTEACRSDVVLSTGGVSVGSFDYVRRILFELGYEERFWKVAQKPGKPLTFGFCGQTPVFGLPGNPVSSLVCFYVYVVPALRTMSGWEKVFLPNVEATLADEIAKANGMTEFIRCALEGAPERYSARSTGTQSSGVLKSLALGDGLIVGPADQAVLRRGERLRVLLLSAETAGSAPPF
jgi:molybdopterin molybdotransferase